MQRARNLLVVMVCAGWIGCSESEPELETSQSAIIHEAVDGFDFLPPIAPKVPLQGVFDPTLSPVVQIDQVHPLTGSTIASIATLTKSDGRGSERVRVSRKKQLYVARWHTRRYDLDPDAAYRIRILLDGLELGYADVDVVARKKDLKHVDAQHVGVVNGRTLPIKFRIAGGIVPPPPVPDTDGDGVCDVSDNCPTIANSNQLDTDDSGIGDACECVDVVCGSIDACHGEGVCEPATGECIDPPAIPNCSVDPPACPGADALEPALAALDQAFDKASSLELVGEPRLEALLARDAAVAADLAVLRATCTEALQADLAVRLAVLTADVEGWIASEPLGLRSTPPSFVIAGDEVRYSPELSVAPAGFTFSLADAPSGVAIDSSSGLVTWRPDLTAKGAHAILIEARDGARTARQIFTVTVAERRPLSFASLDAAASVVVVSNTGTPLDGAVVRIPARLVATTDTVIVSLVDPAPPASADIRILGAGLELWFLSGRKALELPIEIELPSPALAPGERAGLFTWSPPASPGGSHTPFGVWASADSNGSAGQVTSAGITAVGATRGAARTAQWGNYDIWAAPAITNVEFAEITAAVQAAHTYVVTNRGFRDPSADGRVRISVTQLGGRFLGRAPDRRTILLNRGMRGAQLRNTVGHELFHLVQFHTPWKLGRGGLEYDGGARWWMEATAELVGNQFTGGEPRASRLYEPEAVMTETLTTWRQGSLHQYDSFIFFDFLTKRYSFDMKAFWESVVPGELMQPNGAGRVLLAYAGQDVDGIPYLPFVHAYATARTSANFDLLSMAKNEPSYFPVPIPDSGTLSITEGHPLAHLSSRTYRIVIPPAGSSEQRLMVTLSGANVEAWIYVDGGAAPFTKLHVAPGEQDVGSHPGQTLWVHVGNTSVDAAGDGTFGLAFRLEQVAPEPEPVPEPTTQPAIIKWYMQQGTGQLPIYDSPLESCAAWTSTLTLGASPYLVTGSDACWGGSGICCWYSYVYNGQTLQAGNIGVLPVATCPTGWHLVAANTCGPN